MNTVYKTAFLLNVPDAFQNIWNSEEEFGNGIVDMSYPCFLRNNTICLFYWGLHCGMTCGHGTLSVYVKRDGRWKEFTSLYSFDS